jgi:hypothetical protein
MDLDFGTAFAPAGNGDLDKYTRLWELTSTRYILGMTGYLNYLNNNFDPGKNRFRVHTQFNFAPKPGKQVDAGLGADDLTTIIQTNGPFAIFEFTGAHPRAKLYNSWQSAGTDQEALGTLSNPEFDVSRTALISEGSTGTQATPSPDTEPGVAEITSYAPRDIEIKSNATAPSLLVLNDRYHPDWHVYIDGERSEILRSNYLMRGVFVPEGEHLVTFKFEPAATGLYAGVMAWITALGIIGIGWQERKQDPPLS